MSVYWRKSLCWTADKGLIKVSWEMCLHMQGSGMELWSEHRLDTHACSLQESSGLIGWRSVKNMQIFFTNIIDVNENDLADADLCCVKTGSQVRLCRTRNGRSLADLQQFFTGKLYVLVQQLKLPAEELLWSALSCTGDPSVCTPEWREKTAGVPSVLQPRPSLRGGAVTCVACSCVEMKAMTPAVSCNKKTIQHGTSWSVWIIFHEFWWIYVLWFYVLTLNVHVPSARLCWSFQTLSCCIHIAQPPSTNFTLKCL